MERGLLATFSALRPMHVGYIWYIRYITHAVSENGWGWDKGFIPQDPDIPISVPAPTQVASLSSSESSTDNSSFDSPSSSSIITSTSTPSPADDVEFLNPVLPTKPTVRITWKAGGHPYSILREAKQAQILVDAIATVAEWNGKEWEVEVTATDTDKIYWSKTGAGRKDSYNQVSAGRRRKIIDLKLSSVACIRNFESSVEYHNATVISIDVETWEEDLNKVTEGGIAWTEREEVIARHLIIKEHKELMNGKYVPERRHLFQHGESKFVEIDSIRGEVEKQLGACKEGHEKVVLVGFNVDGDVKWLKELGINVENLQVEKCDMSMGLWEMEEGAQPKELEPLLSTGVSVLLSHTSPPLPPPCVVQRS
ncbi:hypothetical protein DL98DRAFT_658444 [Cadophora sp. DSE1049]|nr:hypothetical protein DL98DRAFT_658444 [Cadophora sp. DSE1049]